jgi:hypothetical protein
VNLYGTCDVHPADDYVTDVFDKKKKKRVYSVILMGIDLLFSKNKIKNILEFLYNIKILIIK